MLGIGYNNTIVTVSNSLLQGFSEQLNRDLAMKAPSNMRFKLMSATGTFQPFLRVQYIWLPADAVRSDNRLL